MSPTAKEKEISVAKPEAAQVPAPISALPGDSAIKQQPVALEVPVTINGARTVEGSDKREPFSETTKTVLVFGNGAVIRLSSSVAPGQLLFLTNEKTKREVVCQVVKSKNYRNVSGYVELEFTESVVGFWGMRFPGDRISPAPQVTPSVVAAKPAGPISLAKEGEPKFSEAKSVIPTAAVAQIPPTSKVAEPVAQKPFAPLSSALSTSFDPGTPSKLPSATPVATVIPVVPAAPVSTVNSAPANPVPPAFTLFDSPRTSEVQASFLEPLEAPAAPSTVNTKNSSAVFEVRPATPSAVDAPQASAAGAPQDEALKLHTARLQEQLSSMQFSGAPAVAPVQIPHPPPVTKQKELAESTAKVLEMSRTHVPEPVPAKSVASVKLDPPPAKSPLDDQELKIPAWLEPLARNAATPASTEELIEREKAKRLTAQLKVEETAAETVTGIEMEEANVAELPLQTFDDPLPVDEEGSAEESGSGSSSRGMLMGVIAAGVLLLAGGGWWYMRPQSGGANADPAPASNVQASVVSLPGESSPSQPKGNAPQQTNSPAPTNPAALTNTSAQSNSATNPLSVVPAAASAATARNTQQSSNPANGGASVTASAQPAVQQPKKPVLGNVRLAAPKITPSRNTQNGGEADAGIALSNVAPPEPGTETLGAGLVGDNKQPSAPPAPVPVDGDVKLAKLIFSVPPRYPALAKNQHVSGNVLVDALIDADGHVTTMNVVSGPSGLHQAAMDALKQWKYQPATLHGKPVPMHLAVTVQFRLR